MASKDTQFKKGQTPFNKGKHLSIKHKENLSISHNCNPNNLITLCRKCHMKTNYHRDYWKKYFNNLIKQ